jgi:hypothetical protein
MAADYALDLLRLIKRICIMELIAVSLVGALLVLVGHLWSWALERIHGR